MRLVGGWMVAQGRAGVKGCAGLCTAWGGGINGAGALELPESCHGDLTMSLIRSAALTAGATACLILLGLPPIPGCATLPSVLCAVASEPGRGRLTPMGSHPPAKPRGLRDWRQSRCRWPRCLRRGMGTMGKETAGAGQGLYHWNNGPAGWGVLDVPERGYYCSSDPDIIKWQLDGLERAGVQALFVSWWGWGEPNLDGDLEGQPDATLNRGITALLDQIVAVPGSRHHQGLADRGAVRADPGQIAEDSEPRSGPWCPGPAVERLLRPRKVPGSWFEWEGKPLPWRSTR